MNLCIDQGNSRTKVALMTDEGKMINQFIYKQFSSAEVERLLRSDLSGIFLFVNN